MLARNTLQPMTAAAWGIRSVLELDYDETDLLPTHDILDVMKRLGDPDPFVARSNVRYVIDYPSVMRVKDSSRYYFGPSPAASQHPLPASRGEGPSPNVRGVHETNNTATIDVKGSGGFLIAVVT